VKVFKRYETALRDNLKNWIEELKEVRISLEELRNIGLGDEVSYMMFIREGIPKRIVVKPAAADDVLKFTFNKGFSVVRMIQQ